MGNVFPLLVLTGGGKFFVFHFLWNSSYFCKDENVKLINEDKLERLIRKNKRDVKLKKEVDKLTWVIRKANWKEKSEVLFDRPDADCVHSKGFYFFNVSDFRCMILIVFIKDKAEIVWAGNHYRYMLQFKNNKKTIETWLRNNYWIK